MIEQKGKWIHVYPKDDLQEHELGEMDCLCEPEYDFEHGIVIHNAFDLREFDEFLKGK